MDIDLPKEIKDYWTAIQALKQSTFPFVAKLDNQGLAALEQDSTLQKGLNVRQHNLIHPDVQRVFPTLVA